MKNPKKKEAAAMLDNRIYTFLKLCETMNYRRTAEELNMTQPAVTQHIHYLENLYQTKLFEYSGKTLSKTAAAKKLEQYARPVIYNEQIFRDQLQNPEKRNISIGATKTIGEYEIDRLTESCVSDDRIRFKLIIDNTAQLLKQLNDFELDLLLIEGYFDKNQYDSTLFKNQELVGVCSAEHPLANRTVSLQELFSEPLLVREEGSGTRKVFENFLTERNYSFRSFRKAAVISSFTVMERLIEKQLGITFAYKSIADSNKKLALFHLEEGRIFHEFNFVYLKNSRASGLAEELLRMLNNTSSGLASLP